jgi:hypothetical protein
MMNEVETRQAEVTERERQMKQVILSLADLIANTAYTEVELEVPTEESAYALAEAVKYVELFFAGEEITVDFLRQIQMDIESALDNVEVPL